MLFFGVCFFLCFIKLSAGNGFFSSYVELAIHVSKGRKRWFVAMLPECVQIKEQIVSQLCFFKTVLQET